MSSIAGIFSKDNEDISDSLSKLKKLMGNPSPDVKFLYFDKDKWQNNALYTTQALAQKCLALREQLAEEPCIEAVHNIVVMFEGALDNREQLEHWFNTLYGFTPSSCSQLTMGLIKAESSDNLVTTVKRVVKKLDGGYCLAVSNGEKTLLVKDSLGQKPAFYGEHKGKIAFASRKSLLWKIGINNVKPLRGGMLATFSKDGISLEQVLSLPQVQDSALIKDAEMATDQYCTLLKRAVKKRLKNLKKVGVLISGGVDSTLVCKLVLDLSQDTGTEVLAYTAGTDTAGDMQYAIGASRDFGVPLRIRKIAPEEVESYLPKVIGAVENRDMVQIEAGIGIYAALEMAKKDGIKVVFSGQGPDELWGGYSWDPYVLEREGYNGLLSRMMDDLHRGDIETLDRENMIAQAHGMEQVFPYMDSTVVELALCVPPQLKVLSTSDKMGKHIHREAAQKLGVPERYAFRHKVAAQHGTGIHDTFDSIARKNGFTPQVVDHSGYKSDDVSKDKYASSTRYGYIFTEKELWQVPEHVQFYLDSVAYEKGLLNGYERTAIARFLDLAGRHN